MERPRGRSVPGKMKEASAAGVRWGGGNEEEMHLERNVGQMARQVACGLLLFDFGLHSSVQLGVIEGLVQTRTVI